MAFPGRHCWKPALHREPSTPLEKHGSVLCQSQALVPSEPSAASTQGSGHSISLAGEAPGSSWHALVWLQLLPAGPDTWQLHAHCSRDLLARTLCHGTAVTLPGQSPECLEHREASTAAHAHTTHHLQQLPPGMGLALSPTPVLSLPWFPLQVTAYEKDPNEQLKSQKPAWGTDREHLLRDLLPARGRTKPSS